MSTAPQFGSDARHDWLFVDSSGAARFAHAMFWLGRRTRRGIESARMLLERLRADAARVRLRARAARVMHRASIAARAAGALARSVQEHGFADREHSFADRVAPTPARREFARPGSQCPRLAPRIHARVAPRDPAACRIRGPAVRLLGLLPRDPAAQWRAGDRTDAERAARRSRQRAGLCHAR